MGRARNNPTPAAIPAAENGKQIRIQMMGSFCIYINEARTESLIGKSKKGVSLMEYLIMNNGKPVPNTKLFSTLWGEENSSNPESALKTLVSRLRAMLNAVAEGLGSCIVADRGAYHWESACGVQVDVLEITEIFTQFESATWKDNRDNPEVYIRLMKLYTGDLLQNDDMSEWVTPYAVSLHDRYLSAMYAYIDLLKQKNDYGEIAAVCRQALDIDAFDDKLNIELMTALINTSRTSDAMQQYKHVVHLNNRYLGIEVSEDMQEFYKQIVRAGKTLDFSLASIRNELQESEEKYGAFVCEYSVFKEIYNLQMRNLERLGSSMFLGLIMAGEPEGAETDSIRQDNIMQTLLEILRKNLRKGDTVTRISPTTFALLLPTVNYTTGNMIMDRIKRAFYKKESGSHIAFYYRIGPLSSGQGAE